MSTRVHMCCFLLSMQTQMCFFIIYRSIYHRLCTALCQRLQIISFIFMSNENIINELQSSQRSAVWFHGSHFIRVQEAFQIRSKKILQFLYFIRTSQIRIKANRIPAHILCFTYSHLYRFQWDQQQRSI